MFKQKTSTRKLINLKKVNDNSIVGYNKVREFYFKVIPFNLSVLSQSNIEDKIMCLMNVIKSVDGIELVCMNSRENFDSNKNYYASRIKEEPNLIIKELLKLDIKMLDDIQIDTATSRIFLVCIKIKNKELQLNTYINTISKTLMSNGFSCILLDKNQLLSLISIYYTQ